VSPGRLLVGPEREHGERRILGEDPREVVVIGDANIALPGRDRLEDLLDAFR